MTQVPDGPPSEAGCLRGDAAGLGRDHHLAGDVNRLAAPVEDLRVLDHMTGAADPAVAKTESVDWAVVTSWTRQR